MSTTVDSLPVIAKVMQRPSMGLRKVIQWTAESDRLPLPDGVCLVRLEDALAYADAQVKKALS